MFITNCLVNISFGTEKSPVALFGCWLFINSFDLLLLNHVLALSNY